MTASGHDCEPLVFPVPEALAGTRVDRAVALLSGLARRAVSDLVASGRVRVDGAPVSSRRRLVRAGEVLEVEPARPPSDGPLADPSVTFGVVYEDDQLVVVDKPPGLVVHHGAGHAGGTLVDGLLARYPDLGGAGPWADPTRPGIVHRLDKGTSGLLVVARTAEAYDWLSAQMRSHRAGRDYVTLVWGTVSSDDGAIEAPIGRSSRVPTRMALTRRGRPARTAYHVRARYGVPEPLSLLDVQLDTGRTHQVRVHLAAIGHPVVGDERYGASARRGELAAMLPSGRVFLHAARLSIDRPDGRRMTWESPLPSDLSEVLGRLGA